MTDEHDISIRDELERFDGREVASLETLAMRLPTRPNHVDELIALSHSDRVNTSIGATWILNWLQEHDASFSKPQTRELLRLLGEVDHWQVRLHLLKMLDRLSIPSSESDRLFRTLTQLLHDDNKFVRAWSYNGLFVLGEQYRRYRKKVRSLIDEAKHDPAPSVRARLRHLGSPSSWIHDTD